MSYPRYRKVDDAKYISFLKKTINDMNVKPYCIIRYGTPGLAWFYPRLSLLSKKMKVPVVADVADWLSADGNNILFNSVKNLDTFLGKKIFNKSCDGMIVISSYLERYYRKSINRIVVIPPIVRENKRNESDNKTVKIIYAGQPFRLGVRVVNTNKIKDRLDIAVIAFSKLAEECQGRFEFHIYGITKEQYVFAFPNHNHYANSEAIIFHGRKPMDEVQQEICKSDYSILLREKNRTTMAGFPTKVVESITCGTPIITTRTSDLEQYLVQSENCFFVNIKDMEELISQLKTIVLLEPENISKMKERCYREKIFLPECFSEKMDLFLKSLE